MSKNIQIVHTAKKKKKQPKTQSKNGQKTYIDISPNKIHRWAIDICKC